MAKSQRPVVMDKLSSSARISTGHAQKSSQSLICLDAWEHGRSVGPGLWGSFPSLPFSAWIWAPL